MQDVRYVQKKGKNDFHKYTYVTEGSLQDNLIPALTKAGLILVGSVKNLQIDEKKGGVYVEMDYRLTHKTGAIWPWPITFWGFGMDKGDKAIYKAMTGCNKYAMFKLFQIATGDEPEADVTTDINAEAQPPSEMAVRDHDSCGHSQKAVTAYLMDRFPNNPKNRVALLKSYVSKTKSQMEAGKIGDISDLTEADCSAILTLIDKE